jgi:hypothetical protein
VEELVSHVERPQGLPKVDVGGRQRVAAVGQVRMVVADAEEELKGVEWEEAHYCVCRDSETPAAVSIR